MHTASDIAKMRLELQSKSLKQIHFETSMLWLTRALAAYSLYMESKVTRWLLDAQDYEHEAIEHAALSTDGSGTVAYVEAMLRTVVER